MNSRDLAIIISYAGNNPETEPKKVSRYLLDHKIPTAVITSQGRNYLHDLFSNVLEIPAEEHLYTKIATFSTEEAVGFLLDVLFACFFSRNYEEHNASKIQSAAFLENRRSNQVHIPD